MYEDDSIWARKGATFSDKSARQEFGLTQEEIHAAIRAGKLQFREGSSMVMLMHFGQVLGGGMLV